MAITKDNMETVAHLITALQQRHEQVLGLSNLLAQGSIWRSAKGDVDIPLTAANKEELESGVRAYIQESEVIIAAIRGYLPDAV